MHAIYTNTGRMSIGEEIRRLRVLRGLRQGDLAARLHVTRQAVSKWENDVAYPDITLLPALADLLGVTVDELLLSGGTKRRGAPSDGAKGERGV